MCLAGLILIDPTNSLAASEEKAVPLARQASISVQVIEVHGNLAFSTMYLRRKVLSKYEGRLLSAEDLQQMRRDLTAVYVQAGYVNSGAYLPNQTVRNGVVNVNVIEGVLSEIDLNEPFGDTAAYLRDRLSVRLTLPLNTNQLTEQLALLQEEEVVRVVDASLNPGTALGKARLKLRIVEKDPWQFRAVLANDRSPGVGAERLQFSLLKRSLTGRADPLLLRVGRTSGQTDGGIEYSRAIGLSDTSLSAGFERSFSTVVETPFDRLDIDSRLDKVWVSAEHQLVSKVGLKAAFDVSLEGRWGRTSLLGQPFSFSGSSQNGRSRTRSVTFSYDYLSQGRNGALAIRTGIRLGRNGLKDVSDPVLGTIQPLFPRTYKVYRGQLQIVRRVGSSGAQIVGRLNAQFTDDALVQIEKLSLGGVNTVRGYRENQVIRDRGITLSGEYRLPLGQTSLGGLSGRSPAQVIGSLFADYGIGSNLREPLTGGHWLGSIGVGLTVVNSTGWRFSVMYGHRLNDDHQFGSNLQDKGWHLSLSFQTD